MGGEWSRRAVLRIGGLSLAAGACSALAPRPKIRAANTTGSAHAASGADAPPRFGQARSCIFLLLQGGPSHLDLWDPKPLAPPEIRGPFATIDTRLVGCSFTEMVPRTAALAERLAVIRSMEHRFANHIAGTYITLTGSSDQPDADREAKADDFPGPGAVLSYLEGASPRVPVSVSLPTWLSIPGPSNRMPGQYAGMLGTVHDPFLISGEPESKQFRPLALALPEGFGPERLCGRWRLLDQVNQAAARLERQSLVAHDRLAQSAYEMLIDPAFRRAIDLEAEPTASRERYGLTRIGQSLLLARRLVEAGVRWVGYNAFNQEWDTHGGLKGRYEQLLPPLDQAYSALLEDLAERGLLDETLVVQAGEFGRTPQINSLAGRDHWPFAYSVLVAGGGIRGGQVYGASDARGAYVASQPVAPADLLATCWHLLGVDPQSELRDRLGRPIVLCRGEVQTAWL